MRPRFVPAKVRSNSDELATNREWAAANGQGDAARGHINQQVRDAYDAKN